MENILKTFLLLGILSVIFIFIGGFFGGRDGIIMAFVFSLFINGGMYFFSDKLALSASGAKPLGNRHPEVKKMVEDLAQKMKLPMPSLYITPSPQANAFATGRNPNHASVAVTEGILQTLSHDELKGVLAHELSHVKNRDILVASIAAVLASSISFIGNMALFGGHSDDEENQGAGAFALVAAILLPIAASLIQLAISRQREFGADASGAEAMGTGKPLAHALLAIHDSTRKKPMHTNPAFSSLYIDNPLGGIGGGLTKLFSTHPPVEERVKRLSNI